MAPRSFLLTSEQQDYLAAHCSGPDELQVRLIEETRALGDTAGMQIAPDEGALLTLLAKLVGAKSALEIGTFTGYSAMCIARGLDSGGRLLCLDVSEQWTSIARRFWDEAKLADLIELKLGPALDSLAALGADKKFDFVFIDADKTSYPDYWEAVVPRLTPGGIVLADNVLWSGRVWDRAATDESTDAVRRFNDLVAADDRMESVILPVADGLTLARRKTSKGNTTK